MVQSLGGGHSSSSYQGSFGHYHDDHHHDLSDGVDGHDLSGSGGGVCFECWVTCSIYFLLCVFAGAVIMLCFGVEALMSDQELIAASKANHAAWCVVVGVGAVKGGVFELRYRLDEHHCYDTSWQNVPYGPFTPEAHPVDSKITCYGTAPVQCHKLLVVYKWTSRRRTRSA